MASLIIRADGSNPTRYHLSGLLDDDAGLALDRLAKALDHAAVLNLRGLKVINSMGVRAWINFERSLRAELAPAIEEASPAFVDSLNMIPAFLGRMQLRSVVAFGSCKGCRNETTVLVDVSQGKAAAMAACQTASCRSCGKAVEMDVGADYFDFIEMK